MSLLAHTNLEGSYFKYGVFPQTLKWIEPDGDVIRNDTDHTVIVTDWCSKAPVSKHSWRTIHGKPWRDPTSWHRYIVKMDWKRNTLRRPYAGNPSITEELDGVFSGPNPWDFNPDMMSRHLGILNTDGKTRAVTECLLRLNEGKAKVGQYLAESKQSASMIADSGTDLLNLLLKVKRREFSNFPKEFGLSLRKGRDAYLQWQFGWKPLCSDIHALWENLIGRAPIQPFLRAAREIKTPFEYTTSFGGYPCDVKIKHTDKCVLYASLSEQTLANMQSYDVINPLSLAWELVPYSFVVDWFAPIGNTLAALTATAGLDFVGGFSTQIREGTNTIRCSVGHVEQEFYLMSRYAYDSFPQAGYYGKTNPLNLDKAQKLLALLSQLV